MLKLFSLVFIFNIVVGTFETQLSEDTIQLDSGFVRGIVYDNARVFRGIPYAEPPVGNLRWQDPVPVSPWTGILDGTQDRDGCVQNCVNPKATLSCPATTSENCLYLTLITPRASAISKPLPIMFFIHGGQFIAGHGGGGLYNGTKVANRSEVIIVSINYRLGALGFISMGEYSDINGNYGIKDQILALNWVQRNANNFGGDASRVTIFGQSAGAMSVNVLLVSPLSRGKNLFQSAILESHPFTIPFRDVETMMALASSFASYVGCSIYDSVCLRNQDADWILNAQQKAAADISADKKILELFVPFTPLVDGKVLNKQPMTALLDGDVDRNVTLVFGNTRDEASMFIYQSIGQKPISTLEYEIVLAGFFGINKEYIGILEKYPPPPHSNDTRDLLSVGVTDYIFICPTRNVTRELSKLNITTYLYMFDHLPSFSVEGWYPETECYTHVCDADELPFVFYSLDMKLPYTDDEKVLATSMIDYWTGIAWNGDPNSRGTQSLNWPVYTASTSNAMDFQTPENTINNHVREEYCDFWDEYGYGF